ncbi:hypothetical protein [Thiobacillus sp.]
MNSRDNYAGFWFAGYVCEGNAHSFVRLAKQVSIQNKKPAGYVSIDECPGWPHRPD